MRNLHQSPRGTSLEPTESKLFDNQDASSQKLVDVVSDRHCSSACRAAQPLRCLRSTPYSAPPPETPATSAVRTVQHLENRQTWPLRHSSPATTPLK